MGVEIERKYLVDTKKLHGHGCSDGVAIEQGYLSLDPKRTVRIRVTDIFAWITVKGITEGISRAEYEYSIPVEDAKEMIAMCDKTIKKNRIIFPFAGHQFEVDIFKGHLEGLVIAEVELKSEDEVVELPDWITEEVSDDPRFYNSNLINLKLEDVIYTKETK